MLNNINKRPHWYLRHVYYCPLCGRQDEWKERKYTDKPKEYKERVEWVESWDGCNI